MSGSLISLAIILGVFVIVALAIAVAVRPADGRRRPPDGDLPL